MVDEKRLAAIPLFAGLSKNARRHLAMVADEVDVREGKELIHEGRFAYEFFVIEEGTAEVVRAGEHVDDVGPGDFFGEVAAMEDGVRNATVRAKTPLTVIVIRAGDFRRLADEQPAVAEQVRKAMQTRRPQPAG
jgi:CRP/FNR family transcriptional regulator, cyclic AMP receptor protein